MVKVACRAKVAASVLIATSALWGVAALTGVTHQHRFDSSPFCDVLATWKLNGSRPYDFVVYFPTTGPESRFDATVSQFEADSRRAEFSYLNRHDAYVEYSRLFSEGYRSAYDVGEGELPSSMRFDASSAESLEALDTEMSKMPNDYTIYRFGASEALVSDLRDAKLRHIVPGSLQGAVDRYIGSLQYGESGEARLDLRRAFAKIIGACPKSVGVKN